MQIYPKMFDMMAKIMNQLLAVKEDVSYTKRMQDQCVENAIWDFITAEELSVLKPTIQNEYSTNNYFYVMYSITTYIWFYFVNEFDLYEGFIL